MPPALKSRVLLDGEEKLSENVLCVICRDVLLEPQTCNACANNFCRRCIEGCLRLGRGCPCGDAAFSPAPPVVLKMLAKRRFACEFVVAGCTAVLGYDELAAHAQVCRLRVARCRFDECPTALPVLRLPEHERGCEFRPTECPFCAAVVSVARLPAHEESCPQKMRECPACGERVQHQALPQHLAECPRASLPCPFCDTRMSGPELTAHDQLACFRRAVTRYRESGLQVLHALSAEAERLLAQLRAREGLLRGVCGRCRTFACEAQLTVCAQCRQLFCEGCRRGAGICEDCQQPLCAACIDCAGRARCFACEQKPSQAARPGRVARRADALRPVDDAQLLIRVNP